VELVQNRSPEASHLPFFEILHEKSFDMFEIFFGKSFWAIQRFHHL